MAWVNPRTWVALELVSAAQFNTHIRDNLLLLKTAISDAGLVRNSGILLTDLNASELASGTIPDGRFPAVLPAVSGVNLTALQAAYPVGSLYFNASVATNPATLLGFGTWAAWGAGRVPVSVDPAQSEFNTVGETGGSKTHTLTTAELPAHTHIQNAHTHTQTSHNHTQDSHNHTQTSHSHTQDSHNHTQVSHTHTQTAHTHTDSGHNHTQAAHNHSQNAHAHGVNDPTHSHLLFDPGHSHQGVPFGYAGDTLAGGPSMVGTDGTGFTNTSLSGLGVEPTESRVTIQNQTATNIATTATNNSASAAISSTTAVNNSTTATNSAATATNQATTATNNAATATNQATTAVNNNATAVNQSEGGGGAHNNLMPYRTCFIWERTA